MKYESEFTRSPRHRAVKKKKKKAWPKIIGAQDYQQIWNVEDSLKVRGQMGSHWQSKSQTKLRGNGYRVGSVRVEEGQNILTIKGNRKG